MIKMSTAEAKRWTMQLAKRTLVGDVQGCRDIVSMLQKPQMSLSAMDPPLILAAMLDTPAGHEIVRLFLDNGFDPNIKGLNDNTPLHQASHYGNETACQALLSEGLLSNHPNKSGEVALHLAAKMGHVNVCALLIDAGTPIDVPDGQGETALSHAILAKDMGLCTLLLEKGASMLPTSRSFHSPVHKAVTTGSTDLVSLFLSRGFDVNDIGSEQSDPGLLHHAAENGDVEMARFLIQRGAQVDLSSETVETPLCCAARSPNDAEAQAMCEFLLSQGADLHAANRFGDTPLHAGVTSGHWETSLFLLKKGADPHRVNKANETPLDLSVTQGGEEFHDNLQAFVQSLEAMKAIDASVLEVYQGIAP
jgi:ankyrin repeat protein